MEKLDDGAEEGAGLSSHLHASPFQPQRQGISFDVSAKPFVPPPDSASKAASGLSSSTVNAAPFVPGGGGGFGRSASASTFSTSAVNAAPFVPNPIPHRTPTTPPRQGLDAASFVPGGVDRRLSLSPHRQAAPTASRNLMQQFGTGHMLPDGDDLLGMTAHHAAPVPANVLRSMGAGPVVAQMAAMSMSDAQRNSLMAAGQQVAAIYNAALQQQQGTRQMHDPAGMYMPQRGSVMQGRGRAGGGRYVDLSKAYGGRGPGIRGGGGRGGRGRQTADRGSSSGGAGPGRALLTARFVSERLRAELQQRASLVQAQLNPETDGDMGLPQKIHHYHTLYPLEDLSLAEERPSMSLGIRSFVLKGISAVDGQAYALRWIDGRQVILTPELINAAHEAVERWAVLSHHPHLVCPRQALATKEVEDTASLVFAYEYHPGAVTMEAVHMQPTATENGLVRHACSEDQLWSYLVQISSALRAMHSAGLVARPGALVPSKVLLTSAGRLRIGSLGLLDVLTDTSVFDQQRLQREDLTALGRLMLTMACAGGPQLPNLEYCASYFSADFVTILRHLLSSADGGTLSNGKQLVAVLGERVMIEMETSHLQNDALINELSKECENGRLLRLLVKLGCINERPDGDMDMQWSETGDRYLLKLFRDFVFHQTSEEGAPVIDWGHMMEALNKLDAGVQEKILLLSRDEMSMLVASYADIKRCAEGAFNELKTRAKQAQILKSQQQMLHKHHSSHMHSPQEMYYKQ